MELSCDFRNLNFAVFTKRLCGRVCRSNCCACSFTGQERTELVSNRIAMHNAIEELHFILHDSVQPQRRLFARMTVLDCTIHFCAVINLSPLIVFFLGLMNQIMLFFTICSFNRHADIAHINFNVAFCTLNQHIMLRIVEGRAVFHNSVGAVSKFQQEEQHIVLVAKLFTLMRNITASHGNLCCRSHQELNAVQLVEVPFAELPAIQKYLITKCRLLGKRVITATEMLESMIHNPRPTRAEISDVANAVYDGTSAVMLSGESAAGKYPVRTVQTMAEIVEETEKHIDYEPLFRAEAFQIKNMVDAISHATCCMACDIHAKAIVVSSLSGATVRMVSRFRVPVDIIGMATNERVWYRLALSWGVQPVLCEETFTSTDVLFYNALRAAKKAMHLQPGDNVVMTGGITNGKSGNTNLIKIEAV